MTAMTYLRPPLSAADHALIGEALREDQLLVMPTDTVYGIASLPSSTAAVERLLAAKGRGRDMPSPVLVDSAQTASTLARDLPQWAQHLLERYWPGALTLICNRSELATTFDLGQKLDTIAIRMPAHPLALEILQQAGPLAVTSANLTGEPPATSCAQAWDYFGSRVEVYCDGGGTAGAVPSTIVDATSELPRIIREGVLTRAEILDTAGVEVEE